MLRILLLLFFCVKGFSQDSHPASYDTLHMPAQKAKRSADNILQAFEHGHFHGNFRLFGMITDNQQGLSDYYALAGGGSLHFKSAPWHGFGFGIGGVFNYNLLSSDLSKPDSATGVFNRYEIGLFDVENPHNREDLDRIEELWIRYQWKKSRITIGQQSLQTPFINPQDGRMRPTAESGAWIEWNQWQNTQISGGWLWKISPRSTVKWYTIGESIGLYPRGLNPDGSKSGYPENVESKGIGLLAIKRQIGKGLKLQFWNQYVENIFNISMMQSDIAVPLAGGHTLLAGIQAIRQQAIARGGNEDLAKTYIEPESRSYVLSLQLGWQFGQWQVLTAGTRITTDGRFLSPREWGHEPFYTFMSRERIEGSGNANAVTARLRRQGKKLPIRMELAYGHFYLPDIQQSAHNKYAFPSYNQLNLDIQYSFGGALQGLRAHLLYVYKGLLGHTYGDLRYEINKVHVSLLNLVLNYEY